MPDDTNTPGPLDAVGMSEGHTVSKLDLLLSYVRGLVAQNKSVLMRLEKGDRKMDDHERRLAYNQDQMDELRRLFGRKTKPEPNWWLRGLVVAGLTTLGSAIMSFVLKGGLAHGLTP